MNNLQSIKLILDSNSLANIYEIDELSENFEYFYPDVDSYLIKARDLPKVEEHAKKTSYRNVYSYQKGKRDIKKIVDSCLFKGRFHKILRPDKDSLGPQTFTSSGPLPHTVSVRIQNTSTYTTRWNEIISYLKDINPTWENHFKDLVVLATVIFASNDYHWFHTLDDNKEFTMFFDDRKPQITNHDGKKYFVTNDTRSFFSQSILRKVSSQFRDLEVLSPKDIFTKYMVSTK